MDKRGFTIIEAVLGGSLITISAMAMSSMISDTYRHQRFVQSVNEFELLKQNIQLLTSKPNTCQGVFRGVNSYQVHWPANTQPGQEVPIGAIVRNSTVIAQSGMRLQAGLTVDQISFRQTYGSSPVALSGGNTAYTVDLILGATRNSGDMGGAHIDNSSSPIRMYVYVNPFGNVTDCGLDLTSQCYLLGPNYQWDITSGYCVLIQHEMKQIDGTTTPSINISENNCSLIFSNETPGTANSNTGVTYGYGCSADLITASKICQKFGYTNAIGFQQQSSCCGHSAKWNGSSWELWDEGSGGDKHWITGVTCVR